MTDHSDIFGEDPEPAARGASPWSRPPGQGRADADADLTWIVPPRRDSGPSWESLTDPDAPDSTTSPSRGRRSLAGGVLVAFLIAFLVARVIGPEGFLHTTNNGSPGVQFIPTNPFAGNGAAQQPSQANSAVSPASAAVAAKVQPGVVDINTELAYQHASAAGTGMVLTPSGQVLTNNHVVEGATTITATVVDTGQTYTATVVGTDRTDDIAVLQLKGASGLDTVPIGDSTTVRIGDQVVALGNAGGVGGAPSIKAGSVSAVGQTITVGDEIGRGSQELANLIVTTAPLESGDSGGPLANAKGQVIGMDTAATVTTRFRSGTHLGFAIPITDAMAVVHQIESGQADETVHIGPTAFLGVSLAPGNGGGAIVAGVESGSPAASAGLNAGDTVTSADGQAVDSAEALSAVIQAHHPGDKLGLRWTDGSGASHSATVKLATGPTG